MVPLIIIITVVVFIIVDIFLRLLMQRIHKAKLEKERAEALDIGLQLDFADEAKSLKRVEVENPKAKILAVDDEKVVLDSFRKILVLAGYSIDTVETGKEALGLVQKNDYDFVFTDLKMPEMDGIEVTKAVKHLRPDIDVIIITGYATVESAVETMKYGAMDYVQKPFTEEELVDFVNKSLFRRQDRIEKETKMKVRLVTPSAKESGSDREFNVPSGAFISPAHVWAIIELNGNVRLGIDDFAQKTIGKIDEIELPRKGTHVKRGDSLFSIKQGSRSAALPSPLSGRITSVNTEIYYRTDLIKLKPYEWGWVCYLEPTNLSNELRDLKIGAEAISWYQEEIDKYSELMRETESNKERVASEENGELDDEIWKKFSNDFLKVKW